MKGLNHDVQNIIENLVHCYRTEHIRNEYRQIHVFNFCNGNEERNIEMSMTTGYKVYWSNFHKSYWLNGKLHRNSKYGAAYIVSNGYKEWYYNGKLHRNPTDGPAIEYRNGTKEWWLNGSQHRENGPAVEYPNGTKEWWFQGHYYHYESNTKKKEDLKRAVYIGFLGGILGGIIGLIPVYLIISADINISSCLITCFKAGVLGILLSVGQLKLKQMMLPFYWKYFRSNKYFRIWFD